MEAVPSFMETLPNDLQVLSWKKEKIKNDKYLSQKIPSEQQTCNDKIVATGDRNKRFLFRPDIYHVRCFAFRLKRV